jgi:hypothetical protein
MRNVMNEQLRKVLGISIAYGGDGDAAGDAGAAADDAAADANLGDSIDAAFNGNTSLANEDVSAAVAEMEQAYAADPDLTDLDLDAPTPPTVAVNPALSITPNVNDPNPAITGIQGYSWSTTPGTPPAGAPSVQGTVNGYTATVTAVGNPTDPNNGIGAIPGGFSVVGSINVTTANPDGTMGNATITSTYGINVTQDPNTNQISITIGGGACC